MNNLLTANLAQMVRDEIQNDRIDPYVGTCFEGWIKMHQLNRGLVGEKLVRVLLEAADHVVTKPGHTRFDLIIDGIKVEVKTCIKINGKWTINHIRKSGEWQRLVVLLIDEDATLKLFWMDHAAVVEAIDAGYFSRQSGGVSGGNDDWKCGKVAKLSSLSSAHQLGQWNV